jgi:hemerythrin-like domain-containing protein
MAPINHLRVQHHELIRLAQDIARLLDVEQLDAERTAIRLKVATFARKFRVHLVVEGRNVFERLLRHSNPAIVAQATEGQRELNSLRDRVGHISRQWLSSGAVIDDSTNKLIDDTKNVLGLVSRRLELEESELYPLVDHIPDRSGTWPLDSTTETDETRKTG